MTEAKQCPKCKQTLPRTAEFWPRDRSRSCGLHPYCRACHVAASAATKRKQSVEQRREAGRRWYARNHEAYNARRRETRREAAEQRKAE